MGLLEDNCGALDRHDLKAFASGRDHHREGLASGATADSALSQNRTYGAIADRIKNRERLARVVLNKVSRFSSFVRFLKQSFEKNLTAAVESVVTSRSRGE